MISVTKIDAQGNIVAEVVAQYAHGPCSNLLRSGKAPASQFTGFLRSGYVTRRGSRLASVRSSGAGTMCLVGHFLSQRTHGKAWKAAESKMSAADRGSASRRQFPGQACVPELGSGSSSTVPLPTVCHAPGGQSGSRLEVFDFDVRRRLLSNSRSVLSDSSMTFACSRIISRVTDSKRLRRCII